MTTTVDSLFFPPPPPLAPCSPTPSRPRQLHVLRFTTPSSQHKIHSLLHINSSHSRVSTLQSRDQSMALTTRQSSDSSTSQFSEPKKRRKLLLLIITSSFLLSAIIAMASALFARHAATSSLEPTVSHAILRSSCSSARYPDLCYSAVATSLELIQTISQPKDVIHASLNLTITAIRSSFRHVEWLSATRFHLTTRERTALLDCLLPRDVPKEAKINRFEVPLLGNGSERREG